MRVALIPPLLAVCWGLNWPVVKVVLGTLPPFSFRCIGLGGGALLLLLIAKARGQDLWPQRGAWPGILVGGLLSVVVFNFCTVFAQLSTSTSRATVLTYTMPMMAALLAWMMLGERPGRRAGVSLLLGSTGIAVLAWPVLQGLAGGQGAGPVGSVWGLVFPLLAALGWAAGTVAAKRWPPQGDRIVFTAWQLAMGGVVGGVAALLSGESLPAVWPPQVIVAVLYHVVIATALAYVWWYQLLSVTSATVSALTTLAVPVVGVIGAMILVGERPGPLDLLGFALVLGGAAAVILQPRRAVPLDAAEGTVRGP